MKTSVYSFIFSVSAALSGLAGHAADLIVVLGGLEEGNNFASISAAHAAAADGDRILIYPNVANYIENITLTKSVQLLSAVEGEYYKVQGSITITPAAAGKSIEIHHMDLQSGYGITFSNAPGGDRSHVKVIDSKLRQGNINANAANYIVNFSGDSLFNGRILFRNGRVIGNYAFSGGNLAHIIQCYNDVATDDVNYIVGNRIRTSSGSNTANTAYGVFSGNSTQTFHIANNFILMEGAGFVGGIYMSSAKTGVTHLIENNTIVKDSGGYYLGVGFANYTGVTANCLNNIIVGTSSSFGYVYQSNASNFINVSYNYASGSNMVGVVDNGTNVVDASLAADVNPTDGTLAPGSVAIDGGHPDEQYSDIDGTRNDAGCWGGSYTRENFIQRTGGSVTNFVIAPRRILSGGTINISSEGYDR